MKSVCGGLPETRLNVGTLLIVVTAHVDLLGAVNSGPAAGAGRGGKLLKNLSNLQIILWVLIFN